MDYLNFLFCFDKNYNEQALTSINSLIENMNSKFRIFIIHKDKNTFDLSKIMNNDNLANISIFQFKPPNINLPDTYVGHISTATYYKLFCSDYVNENIDYLIYVDSDFLCVNNPEIEIYNTVNQMKVEDKPLAAFKEYHLREESTLNPEHIRLLNLKNQKYFNAGFLIFDYKYFKSESTRNNLLKIIETRGSEITMMDQDILNLYFDGNFVELKSLLNFNLSLEKYPLFDQEFIKNNVLFIHYKGKPKPWEIRYSSRINSQYYQNIYRKYNSNNYLLVSKNKKRDIKFLLVNIIKLEFLNVQKRFRYLFQAFLTVFRKN